VEAICRRVDPALFFHPEGERGRARRNREEKAKQVCAQCPVMAECRAHALTYQEPFGIWGGLTEEERSRFLPARAITLRTHRSSEPNVQSGNSPVGDGLPLEGPE
jgi:WhiB family transcriptional regulator, redox-sensing transcriptional regulator